ncbi:MAG TPA: hypothetical protein VGS57_11025 [Thermoanaerobaculia bacterium]|jgi:hypothetical protein|nr:hypothetical protein [Thermoanaerobaculia bacterium]
MQATRRKVSLLLFVLAAFAAISPAAASLSKLPDLVPQHQLHQVDIDRLEAAALNDVQLPAPQLDEPSRFSLWWPPPARHDELLTLALVDTSELAQTAEIPSAEPPSLPETRVRAFALFDLDSPPASNRISRGNASSFGLALVGSRVGRDTPSLYAFVGHQPNMGLDPLGLGEIFAEPVGGAYQAVAAEALDNRNTGGERVAATGLALATMPAAGLEGLFNTLVDTPIRMWRTSPVAARETLATFKAKDADSRIRHGAAAWGAWGQLFLDATIVEGLAERLLLRSAEKKALQAGAAELDAAGGNGGVGTQPPAPVASHSRGVVPLLPNEGAVGTYDDLIAAGSKGDNLTPHHIPSANHMAQHGVSSGDALAINMESPVPGSGGRHRLTFTYGTQADAAMALRDALAAGVRDARMIYRDQGLYNDYMRRQLQELIRLQKEGRPDLFVEPVASHVVKPSG